VETTPRKALTGRKLWTIGWVIAAVICAILVVDGAEIARAALAGLLAGAWFVGLIGILNWYNKNRAQRIADDLQQQLDALDPDTPDPGTEPNQNRQGPADLDRDGRDS
jgi:hypothetical protein